MIKGKHLFSHTKNAIILLMKKIPKEINDSMNGLIEEWIDNPKVQVYLSYIKAKKGPVIVSGLTDVAGLGLVCASRKVFNRPICIITYNEIQAKNKIKDLEYFEDTVEFFPKKELVTYDYIAESKDLPYARMDVLNHMREGKVKIIVTTIEAMMQKMIPQEVLFASSMEIEVGKEYSLSTIKEKLLAMGYERTDLAEAKGNFSVRGGILDIATSDSKGIRIEFWGDEVDSIRSFHLSSQRSIEMLSKVTISPSHEYLLELPKEEVISRLRNRGLKGEMAEVLEKDIEIIKEGNYLSKIDKYFSDFYTKSETFLDYISKDFLIFLDEPSKLENRITSILKENETVLKMLTEKEKIIPDAFTLLENKEAIFSHLQDKQVIELQSQNLPSKKENVFAFDCREVLFYKANMEQLFTDLREAVEKKKKILLLAGVEANAKRIATLLLEQDIPHLLVKELKKEQLQPGKVIVAPGSFSSGYELKEAKLLVITGEELAGEAKKKRKRASSAFKEAEKVVYSDLKIGDYVVHRTSGIGQFVGITTISADGNTKDYMKLRYQDDAILYVPTSSLDSVRKYIGGGEAEPRLSKLGSKDWANTTARVKKNLRAVARDLIELYAKRQKIKGYAFSKDNEWQRQFEDSFPYTETDDQLRCIEEVKKDMEEPRPMDRLLCGDVGYGKTEVAIRAAFKACLDQKQVAYLVPTTVLADQQYQSFKERMEEFPIRVEVLNRFKTKKQQTEIIKKLKLGEIDVIIGTHRILSQDVEFKDLGLLIIDEEHRFGVKAKEKIKKLKESVDVLTMTATPIPRTLHMSIVGIRDMSVIYEPPQNRKPVQTYVLEYDEEVIREAITKELERGGQVFYLYNQVEGIERKAEQVEKLVPEAKVGFAHGQMSGRELEDIMLNFINQNINVLVCTTILESGIDIPNANTIIVENADRLGLAQLYQIRGRVGRASRQAYAYITYKRDKLLSEVADKRLKAIKEFTEFGSGFKIAMRDLEIRGAGSLLGEIQHGHMEEVGYDTYCKLLEEVVKEMQGLPVEEEKDIQIDLNVSSFIPDTYIENSSQKIEIYQEIALCRTEEDIRNIVDEMIDRYGTLPEEVENLLEIARIKELCKQCHIYKVSQRVNGVVFIIEEKAYTPEIIDAMIQEYKNKLRFSPGKEMYFTLKVEGKGDSKKLEEIKSFLQTLTSVKAKQQPDSIK